MMLNAVLQLNSHREGRELTVNIILILEYLTKGVSGQEELRWLALGLLAAYADTT